MALSPLKRLAILGELSLRPASAVPDALALVEELVPGAGSLLLWASGDGSVAGGYSSVIGLEGGLSYYAEQLSNSREEADLGGSRFREAMQQPARAEVYSEVARLPPAELRETEAYRTMMAPYGFQDLARIVVQHAGRPLGGLAVFRGAGDGPFRKSELAALEQAAPLVGAVLASAPDPAIPDVADAEPGFGLVDQAGRLIQDSPQFRQLLAMLNHHAPGRERTDFAVKLPAAIERGLRQSGDSAASLTLDNAWGRFRVFMQPTTAGGGCGLILERRIPVGLRMFQRVAGRGLSARQLQAACGLAEGCSFQALAERWGVTRHSVITHVNQLYAKLGVATKSQLMNRFVWAPLTGVG
jgi:DNA-binding CsgD family transcriptional regulator